MIVGLVLFGLVAVGLVFGGGKRIAAGIGIPYPLMLVFVGALIGSAFIPRFYINGVAVYVAGSLFPIAFAALFFVFCRRSREVSKALTGMTTVAALYIGIRLLTEKALGDTACVFISGTVCGVCAYLVSHTKLSCLAAVFSGVPLGDAVVLIVNTAIGRGGALGDGAVFDTVALAAVISVCVYECVVAVRRASKNRARRAAGLAEAAEEFDPDEYKRYFDE